MGGIGFLLNQISYSIGNVILSLGLPIYLLATGYTLFSRMIGTPEREIIAGSVTFQADKIVLGAKEIDLRSIKVIEVEMAYKGGPSYGSSRSISDGTANRMRLVYQNPVEEFICFYLESGWQLQALERILREAKQRHAIILIM